MQGHHLFTLSSHSYNIHTFVPHYITSSLNLLLFLIVKIPSQIRTRDKNGVAKESVSESKDVHDAAVKTIKKAKH